MTRKPLPSRTLYPAFLDLRAASVLLVGGGEVAYRKAARVVECGCRLTIVSPTLVPHFERILPMNNVHWEQRSYRSGEAGDHFMTISATDEPEINRQVSRDARAYGRLVNVVDQPDLCSFFVPSTVRRQALCIAISTSGKCPALARHLRRQLDESLSERYGSLLDTLELIRTQIKKKIGSRHSREVFITRIVSSEAVREFLGGNESHLKRMLEGWMRAKHTSSEG